MKPFEIKNLVQNENILQEKRQLLWNMVDPNVKRELQPECVVPSVKKKPRLKKVHLSPPLLKKNYNLPFQIASVYQYAYVPYLQNVHLMLQIFDKKMNNLSEYKNVYYINQQQNWVYLYWIHFRIVSSFLYIFYFLSDFCYKEKNMLTLYKVILENSFRDA